VTPQEPLSADEHLSRHATQGHPDKLHSTAFRRTTLLRVFLNKLETGCLIFHGQLRLVTYNQQFRKAFSPGQLDTSQPSNRHQTSLRVSALPVWRLDQAKPILAGLWLSTTAQRHIMPVSSVYRHKPSCANPALLHSYSLSPSQLLCFHHLEIHKQTIADSIL
jgi:hypothetical protein